MAENQSDICIRCGAKCCTYFCFEIEAPDDYEEFEDIRWYLCHEGVSVHVEDNGDWYISIRNRCRHLTPGLKCRAYDDRPLICRKYDPDNCDNTGGDYGYKELFRTPEELEAYARRTLGEAPFEKARAKARAKIEKKQRKKEKKRRMEGRKRR
jgi:Fe-S-cluster containining protein